MLLLHDSAGRHMCAPQRPTQILDGQGCCIHLIIMICTIMPIIRHCRMPFVSSCRRGTGSFTLLFKDGRMSTKETTLNGNYAFSNTAVKFCGIFTCIIFKQHEIKNRGIIFWLPLAYTTRSKALWFLFRILCLRSWILYFFYVGGDIGGCGGIGGSRSNHDA